jgi:hypothetical protein
MGKLSLRCLPHTSRYKTLLLTWHICGRTQEGVVVLGVKPAVVLPLGPTLAIACNKYRGNPLPSLLLAHTENRLQQLFHPEISNETHVASGSLYPLSLTYWLAPVSTGEGD